MPFIVIPVFFFATELKASDSLYPLKCGEYKMGGKLHYIEKKDNFFFYQLILEEKSHSETSVRIKSKGELLTKESWGIATLFVSKKINPYIVEADVVEIKNYSKTFALSEKSYALLVQEKACLD